MVPLQNEQFFFGFLAFFFIWTLILTIVLIKLNNHYRRLVGPDKKGDLKKVLDNIIAKIAKLEQNNQDLYNRFTSADKKSLKYLQKIGFLRFNPFSDTGGDQSFILSLLDAEENGIILSSLHSRGATRLYAKAVNKGEGENVTLSKEEKEVIKKVKSRRF